VTEWRRWQGEGGGRGVGGDFLAPLKLDGKPVRGLEEYENVPLPVSSSQTPHSSFRCSRGVGGGTRI